MDRPPRFVLRRLRLRRQTTGDAKVGIGERGQDNQFTRRRREPRQRRYIHLVCDKDGIAGGRCIRDQLTHGLRPLVRVAAIIEERIQRRPRLYATEGQLSGFQAAAPPAGPDLADGDAACLESLTQASSLFAACQRQIALGVAVIQPETRWIPDASIGRGMAHDHHVPAGP